MWINVSGETITREANLEAVDNGRGLHRRRLYNDRNINTFDDGFVVQYTTHVVTHDGTEVPLSACLVAEVRDGQDLEALRVPRHEPVPVPRPDERGTTGAEGDG